MEDFHQRVVKDTYIQELAYRIDQLEWRLFKIEKEAYTHDFPFVRSYPSSPTK